MTMPIPVRVRDCACPDTPHADTGDLVYLAPHLDIDGGVEAERDLVESQGNERELTKRWLRTFIRYGAIGWNLTDAEGEAVPFEVDAILSDWSLARPLGDSRLGRGQALARRSAASPTVLLRFDSREPRRVLDGREDHSLLRQSIRRVAPSAGRRGTAPAVRSVQPLVPVENRRPTTLVATVKVSVR